MSDLRHFRFGETDREYTLLERREKRFLDRRSKWVHDSAGKRHVLLYGADMVALRRELIESGYTLCKVKGCHAFADELDHIQGGTFGRCDCRHNLQPLCRTHHQEKHNREIKSAKVSAE